MLRYTPAEPDSWLLLVRDARLLFADTGATADDPELLWQGLGTAEPVRSVLDALTSHGLSATPSFVLARWDTVGPLQILVRGAVVASIDTASTAEVLDGSTVSTWHETTVESASGFSLDIGGAAAVARVALPLSDGAVWAGSVTVATMRDAAAAASAPPQESPASAAAPAPVTPAAPVATTAAPSPAVEMPTTPSPLAEQTVTEPTVAESTAADQTFTDQTFTEQTIAEVTEFSAPAAPERSADDVDEVPAIEGYDHLFEETVIRSIEDAAVRPVDEDEEPEEAAPLAGDHDGETIMSGDIAALLGSRRPSSDDAPRVPESRVLYLELSTGGREVLTEPLLVGRSPSISKVSGGQLPRLVTIPGDQDISRNHARFALEGDTVVVTDLHSRNGTSIVLPGKAPQLLRQGEPTAVLVNTVVDLGGGVTLTVREEE